MQVKKHHSKVAIKPTKYEEFAVCILLLLFFYSVFVWKKWRSMGKNQKLEGEAKY